MVGVGWEERSSALAQGQVQGELGAEEGSAFDLASTPVRIHLQQKGQHLVHGRASAPPTKRLTLYSVRSEPPRTPRCIRRVERCWLVEPTCSTRSTQLTVQALVPLGQDDTALLPAPTAVARTSSPRTIRSDRIEPRCGTAGTGKSQHKDM